MFDFVTFEKKGKQIETGMANFAMRFAYPDDIAGKIRFWSDLDELFHDHLRMEKPDVVLSLHDEGKGKIGFSRVVWWSTEFTFQCLPKSTLF